MTETSERPDFLTVRELAALLRVTERKVYDLAATGQVPCNKATGKLLFPEAEVRAWIDASRTGPAAQTARARLSVILGSHDPLLEWAVRHSGSGLATIFDASLDGLRRFQAGEGVAAGMHVHEADGDWNRNTVGAALEGTNAALIRWSRRQRGFVVRPEVEREMRDVSDSARLRIAPRQSEAGAEVLMREVMTDAGIDPDELTYAAPCRSEQEAVLAVLQGEADAAFGLEMLAAPFGLAFLPVVEEPFDLLVDRAAWFDTPLQSLFAFARSDAFREHAGRMAGVDVSDLGKVIWNA